jgi:hypothetical protein
MLLPVAQTAGRHARMLERDCHPACLNPCFTSPHTVFKPCMPGSGARVLGISARHQLRRRRAPGALNRSVDASASHFSEACVAVKSQNHGVELPSNASSREHLAWSAFRWPGKEAKFVVEWGYRADIMMAAASCRWCCAAARLHGTQARLSVTLSQSEARPGRACAALARPKLAASAQSC